MTPEQEREKLKAEQRSAEEFERGNCRYCGGRGWGLAGRFPTLLTCSACNGTGKQ